MKKGFTLIELMVVVGIIGIMTTVTSNSSSFFKGKNNLRASATRSLNTIKLARSLAIIARTAVCIEATATTINYCNAAPTIDSNNSRAILVEAKLRNLMSKSFKLKNGSVANGGGGQITFDSRGMKSGSQYLRFTATDVDSVTVGYYLIQLSIAGNTRFCKAKVDSTDCK